MCGIFGLVAAGERDPSVVRDGLRYLEYRGYDSWGIAVANDGRIVHQKDVGAITGADVRLPPSVAALGHTRWATHGGVTPANAHPHLDCTGRFALIHNGIVENHRELASRLQGRHVFRSQTDTEVLVHLLEEESDNESDLLQALIRVFRQVQGLSAVAVLDAVAERIVVAKNGSPIVLGWGEDTRLLASDPGALLEHTRRITVLEDGQAAELTPDGLRLIDIARGVAVRPDVREVGWDAGRAELDGHDHFMAKEIAEQPGILARLAETKTQEVASLARLIALAREVIIIGCGTAHHAALSARYQLAELAGRVAHVAPASEASHLLPLCGGDTLVIALSQSGETIDVLEACHAARARGARLAALTNVEGSALDRLADFTVLLECGPERCVLATKSYTAKLALLHLTARALAGSLDAGRREIELAAHAMREQIERLHGTGAARVVAQEIADQQHLFVLGRQRNYPPALEAALKIKEVSYLHAEGFASGELKHGVIALVTHGTPCIILAPEGDGRREVMAASAEVKARGAFTIGLSSAPEADFDRMFCTFGELTAPFDIAAITQLLAYELALARGCDPDRPRNLAKSVTVK